MKFNQRQDRPKSEPVRLWALSRSMKSSTCIGRFIGLYFDHKEIHIKEVKQ